MQQASDKPSSQIQMSGSDTLQLENWIDRDGNIRPGRIMLSQNDVPVDCADGIHYDIFNEDGVNIGYIELPSMREDLEEVNIIDVEIEPEYRNRGYGVELYELVGRMYPGSKLCSKTEDLPPGKAVWRRLERIGLAQKILSNEDSPRWELIF